MEVLVLIARKRYKKTKLLGRDVNRLTIGPGYVLLQMTVKLSLQP